MKDKELIPNALGKILESIETQGILPDMTEEEKGSLWESMSQEDIMRYYQAVCSVEDEERKKILDKWVPRPKILYHGSHLGNIDSFEPREKSKRSPKDPPLVFASPIQAVSAMFLLEHSNEGTSGSYDGGKTWVLVAESLEDLKKRNRPGYLYTLPTDTFGVDTSIGLGLYEWTSETEVVPSSREKVDSALENMLKLGVQIYVPSEEISLPEFLKGDQASLLSKMRKVTLKDL